MLGKMRIALILCATLVCALPLVADADTEEPKRDVAVTETATNAAAAEASADEDADSETDASESPLRGTDLEVMLRRDPSKLKLISAADGSDSIDLRGGYRSVLIVHQTPEGDSVMSCIESMEVAERIFSSQPDQPDDDQEDPNDGKAKK